MEDRLEAIARDLDASSDYRVLRRLKLGAHFQSQDSAQLNAPDSPETFQAVYIDLETTGLNPDQDEIIEIGMVPFTYGDDGRVQSAGAAFSKLREPSTPISEEVTNITGITNEMVRGKTIDPEEVFEFVKRAGLIIAHNTRFDRVFLEKFSPAFADKPWACSMSQIAWKEEGFDGMRLSHIAAGFGFFYEAHRAIEDCHAGIEVLSRPLPVSGERALSKLLSAAREETQRIWAVNAPYDLKDLLKARGYRWNDGSNNHPKAWYLDVSTKLYADECDFLEKDIYQKKINLPVTKISAKNRFSNRI